MSGKKRRKTSCCEACGAKSVYERLTRCRDQLEQVAVASPRRRKRLLRTASPCLLEAIRTCVVNFLKGRVQLSRDRLKGLKRYVPALVAVTRPRSSGALRKRLQQSGGFLPLLMPAIVSLLGGLAGEALGGLVRARSSSSS